MVLDIIGFTLIGIYLVYKLMTSRMMEKRRIRARLEGKSVYALESIMHTIDRLMSVQGSNKLVRMRMEITERNWGKRDKLCVEWSFRNAALVSYVLERGAEREEIIRKGKMALAEAFNTRDPEQEAKWRERRRELDDQACQIASEVDAATYGLYDLRDEDLRKENGDYDINSKIDGDYIEFSFDYDVGYLSTIEPKKSKSVYASLILMDIVIKKAKAKYPGINIYADQTIPN